MSSWRISRLYATLTVAVALIMVAPAELAAATTTAHATPAKHHAAHATWNLRYAMGAQKGDLDAQAADRFAKIVERRSKGRIKIQFYYGGSLGSTQSIWDQVQAGTIEMTSGGINYLAKYVPESQVLSLPWLFQNYGQAQRVLNGQVGKDLDAAILQKSGLRVLGWRSQGFKSYFNRKGPITGPASFHGMKLRVLPNPLSSSTAESLGAIPSVINFSELYTAIQRGVVDGDDLPLSFIESSKLYEVGKYVTLTNHDASIALVVISNAVFRKMPKDLQTIMMDAQKAADDWAWKAVTWQSALARQHLQADGAVFNSLSQPTIASLQAAVAPVWQKFASDYGALGTRLLNETKAAAKKALTAGKGATKKQ